MTDRSEVEQILSITKSSPSEVVVSPLCPHAKAVKSCAAQISVGERIDFEELINRAYEKTLSPPVCLQLRLWSALFDFSADHIEHFGCFPGQFYLDEDSEPYEGDEILAILGRSAVDWLSDYNKRLSRPVQLHGSQFNILVPDHLDFRG